MVFGLGSKSQKGTAVKIEFDILLQEIKPWQAAESSRAPTPVIMSWNRGDKRSGTTKTVVPLIGGPDGGKIAFNEGFKLPATLFEKQGGNTSGSFQRKCVVFTLHEDPSKSIKISRPLASAEVNLADYGSLETTIDTSIPLVVGKSGPKDGGTPTLYFRISAQRRGNPTVSVFTGSLMGSSAINSTPPAMDDESRNSLVGALISDDEDANDNDEIDSFTDEDSPRSSISPSETRYESNRDKLFSRSFLIPSDTIKKTESSANVAVKSDSSTPKPSSIQSSGSLSKDKNVMDITGSKSDFLRLTEDYDKPHKVVGPKLHPPPGKSVAAVAAAGKSVLAAAAAASKSAAAAAAAAYASRKEARSRDGGSWGSLSFGLSTEPTSPEPSDGFMSPGSSNGAQSPVIGLQTPAISSPSAKAAVPTPVVFMPQLATSEVMAGSQEHKGFDDKSDGRSSSVLGEARAKLAMVEKKAIEELRMKVAAAEAKAASNQEKGEERARQLEQKLMMLEDELRDSAAIEVALYSVVAEHGSSSHKVHTPARRLARLYIHGFRNWSLERRANSARNSVSGLIVVSRACGTDVPRLTYWLSNIVVLRETVMQACNFEYTAGGREAEGDASRSNPDGNSVAAQAWQSQLKESFSSQDRSHLLSPKGVINNWGECSTFVTALLRVEAWCHGRTLECVWWKAMTPPMQIGGINPPVNSKGTSFVDVKGELNKLAGKMKDGLGEFAGDVKEFFTKERADSTLSQLGDSRQGNICVEIWKKAFTDAQNRLCPLQGNGHECGCLPMLSRMIIEECAERLDVAMFNGIMRHPEDDSPTDPLADPITDLSVLPIPIGRLTFGAGSQLKNVVVTWSTWLSALVSIKDPTPETSVEPDTALRPGSPDGEEKGPPKLYNLLKATGDLLMLPKDILSDMATRREAARKEAEKATTFFILLRAAGDLLMLPKDMLMDKSVRKEVCPTLSLPLIRRILYNYVPDEFSPDPISPALLAAINAEVSIERQKQGFADMSLDDVAMAPVPTVVYIPPSSSFVRLWIGEPPGAAEWGKHTSSLLRKGYTSDDELDEFLIPLAMLQELNKSHHGRELQGSVILTEASDANSKMEECGVASRYHLLKEVWGTQ